MPTPVVPAVPLAKAVKTPMPVVPAAPLAKAVTMGIVSLKKHAKADPA